MRQAGRITARTAALMLVALFTLLVGGTALAQPSMTSISPAYGGVGPNSPSSWTITGTGFSITPKATRFVDANNIDLFTYVSCSSTTTCEGFGVWGNRVAAGSTSSLAIFALVNGLKSGSFASFRYYGRPLVSSVSPSSGPSSGTSGITITGGPFTSGASFPGMTSIYLQSNISDYASGCTSTTQCTNYTAPSLSVGVKTGPNLISVRTPGGDASPFFTYTPALTTPTITSVTPKSGSSQGGTAITITGSNFLTAANGTTFTFTTPGNSQTATSVVCASTSSCTMVTPGGFGTAVITAFTSNSSSFSRDSVSSVARFTYAGFAPAWTDGRIITSPGNVSLYTSENGAATQYTLALMTQPSSTVSVALSATANGGVRGLVSPTSMSFTPANWFVPQTVTVTGVNDNGLGGAPAQASGNYGYSVNAVATSTDASYNGLTQQMNITNLDNETAGYHYSRTSQLITSKSGGIATTSIVLTKAPTSTVTLNFVSNHPFAGTVTPASMTFDTSSGGATSWNTPRTLTITGAADSVPGVTPYAVIVTAVTADAAYNALGTPPDIYVTNALPTPASIVATATSSTSASVSWSSVSGAVSYELYRCPGNACQLVATPTTTSFSDTTAAPEVSYLYRVRAVASDVASLSSPGDVATTVIHTDDPLIVGTTGIKAVHLTQARAAVNAMRALAGLSPASWTDAIPAVNLRVKAAHVTELRNALDAARANIGLSALVYTNTITGGSSKVKALDIAEIRTGTK